MQRGGGLVLGVARRAQGRQGREVQVAVDNVAAAGQRVGEHVGLARAVDVGAVRVADARRRRPALAGHAREHGRHGAARRRRRRLEVLGHLGRRARGRRRAGLRRERPARRQRVDRRRLLGRRAVALHRGPLGRLVVELAPHRARRRALDRGGERVGGVRHGARELGAVERGGEERARGDEVKGPAGREVVHLGRVPLHLDRLAGRDGLERVLGQVGGLDAGADAVEGDLLGCRKMSADTHDGYIYICQYEIDIKSLGAI